jgi:hypothetical protein
MIGHTVRVFCDGLLRDAHAIFGDGKDLIGHHFQIMNVLRQ